MEKNNISEEEFNNFKKEAEELLQFVIKIIENNELQSDKIAIALTSLGMANKQVLILLTDPNLSTIKELIALGIAFERINNFKKEEVPDAFKRAFNEYL